MRHINSKDSPLFHQYVSIHQNVGFPPSCLSQTCVYHFLTVLRKSSFISTLATNSGYCDSVLCADISYFLCLIFLVCGVYFLPAFAKPIQIMFWRCLTNWANFADERWLHCVVQTPCIISDESSSVSPKEARQQRIRPASLRDIPHPRTCARRRVLKKSRHTFGALFVFNFELHFFDCIHCSVFGFVVCVFL